MSRFGFIIFEHALMYLLRYRDFNLADINFQKMWPMADSDYFKYS